MIETAAVQSNAVVPGPQVEQALTQIWTDVLGVAQIGAEDDFFALGGDSLLSLQIVSKAKARGIPLNYKMIFQSPTIRRLAASVECEYTPAAYAPASGTVPLTPIQERFFAAAGPNVGHWNQWVLLELSRPLRLHDLHLSVQQLFKVHDVLGLRFELRDGAWIQRYAPPPKMPVQWIDIGAGNGAAVDLLIREANGCLDPQAGELLRIAYLDCGEAGPHKLLIVAHHLIMDSVSFHILVSDLDMCLGQCLRGVAPRLESNSSTYRAWAEALTQAAQAGAFGAEEHYWLGQQPAATAGIPCDFQALPAGNTYEFMRSCEISFSEQQTRTIVNKLPTLLHCHINALLLDALSRALNECLGVSEATIDIETHGRSWIDPAVDLRKVTGWYTSIYPQRIAGTGSRSVYDRLRGIDRQLKAVPNGGIGYGVLRYLCESDAVSAQLRRAPAAQICFNYLGQVGRGTQGLVALRTANMRWGASHSKELQRSHLLMVEGAVTDGRLAVRCYYSERLHREATIRNLLGRMQLHLNGLLSAVAASFQRSFRQLAWADIEVKGIDETLDGVAVFYPLLGIQTSILFQHLSSEGDVPPYVVQVNCTLRGALNLSAFERAWQAVVARHESLRTSFHWAELDAPIQAVHRHIELPIKRLDWQHMDQMEQQAAMQRALHQDRLAGFSLDGAAPLMRITVIRLAEDKYFCIWSHHHIQLDGWSQVVVLREVFETYRALLGGEHNALPRAPALGDYFHALDAFPVAQAERYWSHYLEGFVEPTPIRAVEPTSGEGYRELTFEIDASLRDSVHKFAKAHSLTLHTVFRAVWGCWLCIHGDRQDVVFGNVVSGRNCAVESLENLVGSFINTVPVRLTVDAGTAMLEWLRRIQEEQVSSHHYELLPLAQIVKLAATAREELLFQSILVFENLPGSYLDSASAAGLRLEAIDFKIQENYPLVVSVRAEHALLCRISYRQDRVDPRIARAAEFFSCALRALLESADRSLQQFKQAIAASYFQ